MFGGIFGNEMEVKEEEGKKWHHNQDTFRVMRNFYLLLKQFFIVYNLTRQKTRKRQMSDEIIKVRKRPKAAQ